MPGIRVTKYGNIFILPYVIGLDGICGEELEINSKKLFDAEDPYRLS